MVVMLIRFLALTCLLVIAGGCAKRPTAQAGYLMSKNGMTFGGLMGEESGGMLVLGPPRALESAGTGSGTNSGTLQAWIDESSGPVILMKSKNGRGAIMLGFQDDGRPTMTATYDGELSWSASD